MADLTERVELALDGRVFSGWKQVEITRSLDAMCGAFTCLYAPGDAPWRQSMGAHAAYHGGRLGGALDIAYLSGNILGRPRRLCREGFDLARHHGKAAPGLPRACGFDGRIQGQ